MQPIISLRPGQMAAVAGEVLQCHLQQTRRAGFRLFTALVQDASGQVQVVWPNQAFLKDVIRPHQRLVLFGKWSCGARAGCRSPIPSSRSWTPSVESESPGRRRPRAAPHGRIVPVYERTGSVTTNMQRRFVWQALHQLPETLFDPVPDDILRREHWPSRRAALQARTSRRADVPVDALNGSETPAQRRLIFEDFFVFQAGLALRRHENAQVRKARVVPGDRSRRAPPRARCCRSS
jgi:ATP-dependent DNA helicase RecG